MPFFNPQLIQMEGSCCVYPSRKRHGFTSVRGHRRTSAIRPGGCNPAGSQISNFLIPRRTAAAPAVSRAAIVLVTYGRDVSPCHVASFSVSLARRTCGFSCVKVRFRYDFRIVICESETERNMLCVFFLSVRASSAWCSTFDSAL